MCVCVCVSFVTPKNLHTTTENSAMNSIHFALSLVYLTFIRTKPTPSETNKVKKKEKGVRKDIFSSLF